MVVVDLNKQQLAVETPIRETDEDLINTSDEDDDLSTSTACTSSLELNPAIYGKPKLLPNIKFIHNSKLKRLKTAKYTNTISISPLLVAPDTDLNNDNNLLDVHQRKGEARTALVRKTSERALKSNKIGSAQPSEIKRPLTRYKSSLVKSFNRIQNANSSSLLLGVDSRAKSSINVQQQQQQQSKQQQQQHQQQTTQIPSNNVITVDTSKANTNLEVVRLCIQELGWQEYPNGSPNGCDIYWHSSTYHEGYHSTKFAYNHCGSVNKFPCMNQLLRKGPLTLALNVMRSIYPKEYNFYPRTWFLPEQFNDFKTDCEYMYKNQVKSGKRQSTFIVKPNDGSQGDGIYLIKNPDAFIEMQKSSTKNLTRSYIVQEYIDNPLLIDGLKSDLRIYVVVSSLKPLEIHISDEGLVRFATIDYQIPSDQNLSQVYMHLTNYSLNKKNEKYKFTQETRATPSLQTEKGSKRKLTKVFDEIESKGFNISKLKNDIDNLVVKTILALLPEMKVEYAYEIPNFNNCNQPGPTCFQIFGFDILLTDKLKPILLEVNCNPSLRIDYESEGPDGINCLPSPIDKDIKKPLVLETLLLAAPRKKLETIEKHKREVEESELATKKREILAKQKHQERLKLLQKSRKIDLNKCPLLTKPANEMQSHRKLLENKPIHELFSDFTSSSFFLDRINSEIMSTGYQSSDYKLHAYLHNESKKKYLRKIFPSTSSKAQLSHLNLLESVADVFSVLTLKHSLKVMNQDSFHEFIKNCFLVNELISSDNLDIFYNESVKKWSRYNKRKDAAFGLCFQGFLELFITLARLYFPHADFEESLKAMIFYTLRLLKTNGSREQDYCVVSCNGPISEAHEMVKSKLRKVLDLKKQDVKSDPTYHNFSMISFRKPKTSFNTGMNINFEARAASFNNKTKRTLFPIFF